MDFTVKWSSNKSFAMHKLYALHFVINISDPNFETNDLHTRKNSRSIAKVITVQRIFGLQ